MEIWFYSKIPSPGKMLKRVISSLLSSSVKLKSKVITIVKHMRPMHVVLKPSPSITHKYRVMLPNKRAVDFGTLGSPDFTEHRNPKLMRAHLLERGLSSQRSCELKLIHRRYNEVCYMSILVQRKTGTTNFARVTGKDGFCGPMRISTTPSFS